MAAAWPTAAIAAEAEGTGDRRVGDDGGGSFGAAVAGDGRRPRRCC